MEHKYIMACEHVLEEYAEADSHEFPDLLCRVCIEEWIENNYPAKAIHAVCINCVKSKCSKKA
jgi:hypothetical protein